MGRPLCGACLVLALAATARAERSPFLERENPLRSWLPTPEARAERQQVALERTLVQLLARQPGVTRADVVVRLPVVAQVPLDQPLPAARATVLLRTQDPSVDLDPATKLARAALPPGTELQVTRVDPERTAPVSPSARTRATARAGRVGPFRVEEGSAPPLRATLAALLASNALLAGLLLWRRRRG